MLKIGVIGYGTVGSGVVKIIDQMGNKNLKVIRICDIPLKKAIIKERFTASTLDIIASEDIDVVVETMGGFDIAYQLIKAALLNHKHVVTANKEVMAIKLEELTKIAQANNVALLYEASVGGGIPILYNLAISAKINEITAVYGILNGTTNYILSKMAGSSIDFKKALKEAQEKGFAEQNAKADIDGLDIARKLTIMANLAFQTNLNPQDVSITSLSSISNDILEYTWLNNYVVKYLGYAIKKGKNLTMVVEPCLLDHNHPFANINDEYNSIVWNGKFNRKLSLTGVGAGSLPTGMAIVSDLYKIYQGIKDYDYEAKNKYTINQKPNEKIKYLVKTKNNEPTIVDYKTYSKLKHDGIISFYARVWEEDDD